MRPSLAAAAAVLFLSGALTPVEGETLPRRSWILFNDKGPDAAKSQGPLRPLLLRQASEGITQKALERRRLALGLEPRPLVDWFDLPVYPQYVDSLRSLGLSIAVESCWFNAVTAELDSVEVSRVQRFSFVRSIEPVVVFQRDDRPSTDRVALARSAAALPPEYGPSITQLRLHGIDRLHHLGIIGKDILVGMLDTGFRWRTHEALHGVDVKAEYDFLQHDSVTANEPAEPGQAYPDMPNQDLHGTSTLSVFGGFAPGTLIGGAYGASFVLAKTEYVPTETRIEEDTWVAGIEWMERLGVRVVSSSLGYNVFDDHTGYFYSNGDFNGRTAKTTIAAVMAARRGVLVVSAMGNENSGKTTPQLRTLITPADADSIVSVGAVDSLGRFAKFSSCGPTNDERIKPEVSAMGVAVIAASTPLFPMYELYGRFGGTSFATPLTASAATLIVSARPELNPQQIRNALISTARQVSDPVYAPTWPNNYYGSGLVDAYAALLSFPGPVLSNEPAVTVSDSTVQFAIAAVSRDSSRALSVDMTHARRGQGESTLSLQLAAEPDWYAATLRGIGADDTLYVWFQAADAAGWVRAAPAGAPTRKYRFTMRDRKLTVTGENPGPTPLAFRLYQNYPNPFNSGTNFRIDLPQAGRLTVELYNILGERVRTLYDDITQPTALAIFWDGMDARGKESPSGVYFAHVTSTAASKAIKMVLLR